MKFWKFAALCVSISVSVLWGVFSLAQSTTKAIIVRPESAEAGQQELELKGLKTSSEAVGVRVFLDPTTDCKLDVNSKSYLGSVYFSHEEDPNSGEKQGNFVLPIKRKVTGPTRVLICPISRKGSPISTEVEVREAKIKPVDNSAFQ